jgi:catechol 2,3-dioxygenase-like lactoylglutathione lyase family enzyme
VVKLKGLLETAIYVDDMQRAKRFYEDVLGLEEMFSDHRLTAYAAGGKTVFLIFQRGGSTEPAVLSGGTIPGHDGAGPVHFAFAIDPDGLDRWEAHLAARNIVIEGRMDWPGGGKSLYFRDPDGHLVELATPEIWPVY